MGGVLKIYFHIILAIISILSNCDAYTSDPFIEVGETRATPAKRKSDRISGCDDCSEEQGPQKKQKDSLTPETKFNIFSLKGSQDDLTYQKTADRMSNYLKKAAQKLFEVTDSDETIVFLGRTPLWLRMAFKALYEGQRKCFDIAYSGRPYVPDFTAFDSEDEANHFNSFEKLFNQVESYPRDLNPERRKYFKHLDIDIPTDQQEKAYLSYLEKTGLKQALGTKKLIIVDIVESGASIASFNMTLRKWLGQEYSKISINVLGMFNGLQFLEDNYEKILPQNVEFYSLCELEGSAVDEIVSNVNYFIRLFAESELWKLGPHFSYDKWDQEKALQDFSPARETNFLKSLVLEKLEAEHSTNNTNKAL